MDKKPLQYCNLCPHKCQANRLTGDIGFCRTGTFPKVALASLHHWEEPCISGQNGSGAVFFSHCNLKCVYCQNYQISQQDFGREISIEHLSQIFLNLQKNQANNINLVSATPYIPQVREALLIAKSNGLTIPVVYNTNAYENISSLRLLEGLIDIYLPDLKYYNEEYAIRYSFAPDYFQYAASAILEMHRQVGAPEFDRNHLIKHGLIIRHLMLPGLLEDSKKILYWIKTNLPVDVYVSLMAQYTPMYLTEKPSDSYSELQRHITKKEYESLIDYFFDIGLENGFVQELTSASSKYTPSFDLKGINF